MPEVRAKVLPAKRVCVSRADSGGGQSRVLNQKRDHFGVAICETREAPRVSGALPASGFRGV